MSIVKYIFSVHIIRVSGIDVTPSHSTCDSKLLMLCVDADIAIVLCYNMVMRYDLSLFGFNDGPLMCYFFFFSKPENIMRFV